MTTVVEDFKDSKGEWVKRYCSGTLQLTTKTGSVWYSMRNRCKQKCGEQKFRKAYLGCFVGESFKDFQNFANWYTSQVGYGQHDYQLDKDFLVEGNKEYSSHTCLLLPRALNCFFKSNNCNTGVTKNSKGDNFSARMRVDGKILYLGTFPSVEDARQAYNLAKDAEALRWAERIRNKEFLVDDRILPILEKWNSTTYN